MKYAMERLEVRRMLAKLAPDPSFGGPDGTAILPFRRCW